MCYPGRVFILIFSLISLFDKGCLNYSYLENLISIKKIKKKEPKKLALKKLKVWLDKTWNNLTCS